MCVGKGFFCYVNESFSKNIVMLQIKRIHVVTSHHVVGLLLTILLLISFVQLLYEFLVVTFQHLV